VAITQDQGFLLNGAPYPVHGVNRHQDVRGKGWAISTLDEEKDAALIREMGVTAVRNAHYPQSENWHLINDREGVLLWDEVSLVNETRNTREFWSNSEQCLREMIHQLYNHPSIAWWGIFNELGNRIMPPSDERLSRLQSVAKQIDPNRMVVAASCRMNRSFNKVPEQIGLNAYPGWYDRKSPSAMASMITSFSREVGKRIAVSEYGAGGNISHHTDGTPVQPSHQGAFHPEEWQSFVHEGDWAAMKDNPKLWGTFVWNMFDFACQGRHEGNTPALNDKGLVTHDRKFRKDAFFFYKANWTSEPMVHIASARMTPRAVASTEVKVYSNCAEVELKVNGKSIGTSRPDAIHVCRFPSVVLASGNNRIEALAQDGAKTATDACSWTLETGKKTP
jgi:beta-galactosidase